MLAQNLPRITVVTMLGAKRMKKITMVGELINGVMAAVIT